LHLVLWSKVEANQRDPPPFGFIDKLTMTILVAKEDHWKGIRQALMHVHQVCDGDRGHGA
jgi:hypothetical protein